MATGKWEFIALDLRGIYWMGIRGNSWEFRDFVRNSWEFIEFLWDLIMFFVAQKYTQGGPGPCSDDLVRLMLLRALILDSAPERSRLLVVMEGWGRNWAGRGLLMWGVENCWKDQSPQCNCSFPSWCWESERYNHGLMDTLFRKWCWCLGWFLLWWSNKKSAQAVHSAVTAYCGHMFGGMVSQFVHI